MVNSNILHRVFRIVHNNKTASGYTIEKNDNQYFVSASHVFEGSADVSHLMIYHDGQWKNISVQVVFNSYPEEGDTIVFRLPFDISPRYRITYNAIGVALGSWAYFLGFPFGMYSPGGTINNLFPIPFVKAGLVSNINSKKNGIATVYLDGHNNKGFSGGPAVWYPPNEPKIPQIIGTVSNYLTESPIHTETLDDIKAYGTNAGIVEAFWIEDLFKYI